MNKNSIRLALLVCIFLIIVGAIVTKPLEQTWQPSFKEPLAVSTLLTSEEMKQDLAYLIEKLEQVHPRTLNGFTEQQQEVIAACYEKITEPLTAGQFYYIANEVICMMEDAHTALHLGLTEADRVLDLPLSWLNSGLYVRETTDELQVGDKIVAIGGMTPEELYSRLKKIIPAENDQWIRLRATGLINKEPYLEYLDLIKDDKVVVEIRREDGQQVQVVLPFISYETYQDRYPQDESEWVSYTLYREDSLGVLKIDKCINNDHYQEVLDSFFRDVARYELEHVAVDVRSNTGGDSSVITSFLKYLDVAEYDSYGSLIRYSEDAAQQRSQVIKTSGTKTYKQKTTNNEQVKDSSLLFAGQLYVLTSPMTFSSGNWFAVILQDNQLAEVIGEPTGNAPSSYGDILAFQLPVTGYRFSISYKNWLRPDKDKNDDKTLMPDWLVYTTVEDLIADRDAQIEALLQRLRS